MQPPIDFVEFKSIVDYLRSLSPDRVLRKVIKARLGHWGALCCGYAARCVPSWRSRPILKLLTPSTPALPPDVRRGSASPLSLNFQIGLCPWFGLSPNDQRPEAEPGAQPKPQWV